MGTLGRNGLININHMETALAVQTFLNDENLGF